MCNINCSPETSVLAMTPPSVDWRRRKKRRAVQLVILTIFTYLGSTPTRYAMPAVNMTCFLRVKVLGVSPANGMAQSGTVSAC